MTVGEPDLLTEHELAERTRQLADLTATPARLNLRHKTGVNALYGDGSATWVDRGGFEPDLAPITARGGEAAPTLTAIRTDRPSSCSPGRSWPRIGPARIATTMSPATP